MTERAVPRRVSDPRPAPGASPVERSPRPAASARAVLRRGPPVAQDGVRYGDHLRHLWSVAQACTGAAPEYAAWLDRAGPDGRVADRARPTRPQPPHPRPGRADRAPGAGGRPRPHARPLAGQTLRGWSATVVGPGPRRRRPGHRRPRPRPRRRARRRWPAAGDAHDLVVVLEAGDRLEPDLVFHLAPGPGTTPSSRSSTGTTTSSTRRASSATPASDRAGRPRRCCPPTTWAARSRCVATGWPRPAAPTELGGRGLVGPAAAPRPRRGQVGRVPRVLPHLARRPDVASARGRRRRAGPPRPHRAVRRRRQPAGAASAWRGRSPDPPHVTVIIPTPPQPGAARHLPGAAWPRPTTRPSTW